MESDSGERKSYFETTNWSLVQQAQAGSESQRRWALDELLRCYLPALKAHLVEHKRIDPQVADDLIQGFVAEKILARDLVSQADRARGRFRSLLVKSLDHYVIDQFRHGSARKRFSGPALSVDDLEPGLSKSTVGHADAFAVAWARTLIDQSIERMRNECALQGRVNIWELFEQRVLLPALHDTAPTPYDELVERFAFASPTQASNALMTAKRHFRRVVESLIAAYAGEDDPIDEEIAELHRVLAAAGPVGVKGTQSGTGTQTDPGDSVPLPAALLKLDVDQSSPWSDEDLEGILRHQLASDMASFIPDTKLDSRDGVNPAGADPGLSSRPVTFDDLLRHPYPDIPFLEAVKRRAQGCANAPSEEIPIEIASTLYFAAIAAALVRRGVRITQSGDDVLRYGLELMLNRPWIQGPCRELFEDALEALC